MENKLHLNTSGKESPVPRKPLGTVGYSIRGKLGSPQSSGFPECHNNPRGVTLRRRDKEDALFKGNENHTQKKSKMEEMVDTKYLMFFSCSLKGIS